MSHSVLEIGDARVLQYIITHVFFPLKLPDADDYSIDNSCSLAAAAAIAASLHSDRVSPADISQWQVISRMLENLRAIIRSESLGKSRSVPQLNSMEEGDVLALCIRAQNAGVVFRKRKDVTTFESFELSPKGEDVVAAEGKLICSYPERAIEVPNDLFDEEGFLSELANFLVHMNDDDLHDNPVTTGGDQSPIFKDTTHPRYITELLTCILRSVGRDADIPRISKRVGDDVVCNDNSKLPWRRSSLWLLIRVALQTTLNQSLGDHFYKEFMLFFMCLLAEEKACTELPSDLLHLMSTKIIRRFWKLGSSAPDWLSRAVLEACTFLRSTIKNRWKQTQAAQSVTPLWDPSQLDLIKDTQLTLLGSGDYIRNSLSNTNAKRPHVPFSPKCAPRGTLEDFLSSKAAFFEKAYNAGPHVSLYDVEHAVEQEIDAWVNQVTNTVEACENLEILAHKYSLNALKTYGNNPELLSVMYLTMIELWVALDKLVVKETPILADYSPEVPTRFLENLLLCKAASLGRLRRAFEYLSHRHSRSRSLWSVFSSEITPNSFAVRSYKKSSHLRRLKTRIEEVARREVRAKVSELREKNALYDAEKEGKGGTTFRTDTRIKVHEWPLPTNKSEAQAVVFELDCPVPFNMWRTATLHLLNLLVDLSLPEETPRDSTWTHSLLYNYQPLKRYLVKHSRSRITVSFRRRTSIFSSRLIPAQEQEVCVSNGFSFFGSLSIRTGTSVSRVLDHRDNRNHCTYQLQRGSYHNLQTYVDTTSHTSNEIIANQADCHEELSIHEYMVFAHLRSGGLLQWLNILRALRGRSLTFRRHEVHMLFVQAVSQVGPLVNKELIWHQEIQQPTFGYALLGEIRGLIQDIEANWLEVVTMDTISFLLRRLLATSPNQAISLEALSLLRTVRDKVFAWIQDLSARLVKAPGDEGFRGALRDAAAICRSTFDIDPIMIPQVLRSAEDLDVLLSSAMMVHAYTPTEASHLTMYSQLLIDRNRHLSLVLQSVVNEMIQADSNDQGINLAVCRIWPGYHPGSKWRTLEAPDSCWLSCTTAPLPEQCSQVVYLNILDGSLLIDGKPLGKRLPNELERHPLYNLVIGEQVIEVLPSDLPGMDYSTRELIAGHRVYFSLRNDTNLVIRATRNQADTGESEVIELIPRDKLESDLPAALIGGYVHWLNLSTSVMEIRPFNTLWETSPENWRLDYIPGHFRMWKGQECLVDIRSQSWKMVSALMKPLSFPQDLIVSVCPVDSKQPMSSRKLSAYLPHYDLSFFLDEDGDLQSRNIRGMVYDEDQSIGTLFGLVNQLVLRPKSRDVNALELIPRHVLIPDGKISFQKDNYHLRVEINTNHSPHKRIVYHTYRVDASLGCLVGNGSLTSKLYRAYLHALTSGCDVDPLTGRSGTEEALWILQSAGCWSAMRPISRDAELLGLIASMCPFRTSQCADRSIRVERQVLPANPRNYELFTVANAIKEHYQKVRLFHDSKSGPLTQNFPSQDDHLIKRGAQRVACLLPFKPSDPSGVILDVQYSARDIAENGSGVLRAYNAATYIYHRAATSTKDLWRMIVSWETSISRDSPLSLRYERSWLAPKLPLIWLKTYDLLRESDERKWFQLLFSLPAMAYASGGLSDMVPVFVAFASYPQFQSEDPPPSYSYFPIFKECLPSLVTLRNFVVDCAKSHTTSMFPIQGTELFDEGYSTRQGEVERSGYKNRQRSDGAETALKYLNAWPCETPPACSLDPKLYNVTELESKVQNYFSECFRNLKLQKHIRRVQTILDDLHSHTTPINTLLCSFPPVRSLSALNTPTHAPYPIIALDQLFSRPAMALRMHTRLPQDPTDVGNTLSHDLAPLDRLITAVEANAVNPFQRRYVDALQTSAEYSGSEALVQRAEELPTAETLIEHYTQCRKSCAEAFCHVQEHLSPMTQWEQALEQSGHWPQITPQILFRCFASNSPVRLSDGWRTCLIKLALLMLELQRARRLLLLHIGDLRDEFWRELQNEGCDGWDAEARPDWLLIQLEGNFLIRRVQAEVANEMMSPRSGENTAMQLNMGEGKSSVIIPIIAATLADGDQLVRIIVPKSLIAQTLNVLTDRLGGLTNRRIYHLPFSRSLGGNHKDVTFLRQIMLECMQGRGVLVLQPEHVLSLRLASVERQSSQAGDSQLAAPLLELQRWLHSHSRDILDESDSILEPRFQLAFTIGYQHDVDGSSERWTTTQQVLGLVSKHASSLRMMFPLGVELGPGPYLSFPYIRILEEDAGQRLISWIVQDIFDGRLFNMRLGQHDLRPDLRTAVQSFLLCERPTHTDVDLVGQRYRRTPLWGILLLLRGLLAHSILLFVFRERRWRVDYGLDPTRTMLAVPYRAKDTPAQTAEFGHPDVAIVLTCLSYYYGGLSGEQLKHCFDVLSKQHDPSSDYNVWVRDYSAVPDSLRTLSGVNIESVAQWNKFLFPLFSRHPATIDFYLSRVVFPREAKGFPWKLSTSGWDLAEKKECVLTGFSGTNDVQHLLPLHITQRDPDHQRGTNAKVLLRLLQLENEHYLCTTHKDGQRRTSHEFLQILVAQKPEIRVLLDVGAQMLDLHNHELAKAWLAIAPNASAAIYFNEDDVLMVYTPDGRVQPLQSSSFAQQLDRCVVYLDDAHTRGTDIKFPSGFRAAVTLGSRVTKDRLAQGCMRMRELGHGHSVMFFAPREVDQHIRFVAGKGPFDAISTMDILHWAIRETWNYIQRWAPHWVQQGIDHTSRYAAWSDFCRGQLTSKELMDKWLQPEGKKLKDLYEPRVALDSALLTNADIHQLDVGALSLYSAGLDEEQERELLYEVEVSHDQRVKRPSRLLPAEPSISQDIISFVQTGILPTSSKFFRERSKAFSPAFDTLDATSAVTNEAYIWSQSVLVTKDFEVAVESSEKSDYYLRPVHWIVSAKRRSDDVLVILSPHEANYLLPEIRSRKKVHLHLYIPRTSKSMKSCDTLSLYSIPTAPEGWIPSPSFMDQLNVFSGQLYLKDYETYVRLCRFLCVYVMDPQSEEKIEVELDGFILPRNRTQSQMTGHTFMASPLLAIRALMDIRNRGIDFTSTHMGKLVRGLPLFEADFGD